MTETILEVEGLATAYGDLKVVHEVSFAVRRGAVIAILGRNGAGKTTTLRAISGLNPVNAGRVVLNGQDISSMPAHRRSRAGIAYVQEGKQVFHDLTIEQNLVVGAVPARLRGAALRAALDLAYSRFPVLAQRKNNAAASLSGGQQQMLAIAQALMPDPAVLLLDEPSGGLAPAIVGDVLASIRELVGEGLTVVLVEQAVGFALALADDIVVMDQGRVAFAGTAGDEGIQQSIQDAYFALSK